MKFVFKGKKPLIIPELGRVKPGDEFEVNNEKLLPIFKELFEEVKPEVKKVVKKEEVKKEVKDGE